MLTKILNEMDAVITSEMFTEEQDIIIFVILNIMIASILIAFKVAKHRDLSSFNGILDFEKYLNKLSKASTGVTLLSVTSLFFTLRLYVTFFDHAPIVAVPQMIFTFVAVVYCNYKHCKLINPTKP